MLAQELEKQSSSSSDENNEYDDTKIKQTLFQIKEELLTKADKLDTKDQLK